MADKKPLAIFDIDGTLIRSSLLIELCYGLIEAGIFPDSVVCQLQGVRDAWEKRQGSYYDYIMEVVMIFYPHLKGCRVDDVHRVGRTVAEEQHNRVYVFTRELIRRLRRTKTHFLVAMTASPAPVVLPFAEFWEFNDTICSDAIVKDGVYTGERELDLFQGLNSPVVDKKLAVEDCLRRFPHTTLKGSIGVGDTEGDISYLAMVSYPIAFNPNDKLDRHAEKYGWRRVMERKNVIWENGTRVQLS